LQTSNIGLVLVSQGFPRLDPERAKQFAHVSVRLVFASFWSKFKGGHMVAEIHFLAVQLATVGTKVRIRCCALLSRAPCSLFVFLDADCLHLTQRFEQIVSGL